MNGLDVTARGLARRAADFAGLADDGSANLAARSEPTALALEELAESHAALTGYAGAVHTVEYPPYISRDNLTIRGNGAQLRNTDTWDISDTDIISVALPLGSSNITATANLTNHAILLNGTAGAVLNLGANSANYAPGDLVVLHGSTSYETWAYDAYRDIFRHYLRARVISVTGDFVTIDRAPSAELLADDPQIGNAAEGVDCGFGDGPDAFYLLYNPSISNITLSSAVGDAWKWGGVIDGRFRDVSIEGRSALVFNALQDCLFDGIRFLSWRKIAEMAEGSTGSVYRNVRGTLLSNVGRFGNGDDVPPFFIGFTENCRDCVMEDFNVSSGPNTASAEAIVIGSGTGNRIRSSKLYFPQHSNLAVLFSSSDVAGVDLIDCGIENCEIAAPKCTTFLALFPGASGMTRPFVRDTRFAGAPTTGIAVQFGYPGRALSGAILDNVSFEKGSLAFNGTVTGCTIRDCYIPDGFTNLGAALLAANRIHDNDSDANRAARAAAYAEQGLNQTTMTVPNSVYAKAAFPAGSLGAGDRIHVFVDAASGDANAKIGRISATHGSGPTTTALGANTRGSAAGMCIHAEIQVINDTTIAYRTDLWGTVIESFAAVGSIAVYGLTINLELWTANAASPIGVRAVRIIPVKPGMMHLPLR